MIYLLLASISFIVFVSTRKLYRHNFELFLIILIIAVFEYFHVPPQISATEQLADNYWLIVIPIIIYYLINLYIQKKIIFGIYGWWIFTYLSLVLFGVLIASNNGQSIWLGVSASRYYLLLLVFYLVLSRDKIDINKFTKYLIVTAVIYSIIVVVQYVLFDAFQFLHLNIEKIENLRSGEGQLRLGEGQYLIAPATVIAFAKYQKKKGVFYLLAFIWFVSYFLIIDKTRMFLFGISLTALIIFWTTKGFKVKYLVAGILLITVIGGISIPLLEKTTMYEKTVEDLEGSGSSSIARLNSYYYYFNEIAEAPVFGHGIRNINWEQNPEEQLKDQGIYLADIGIVHIAVESGLIGMTWFLFGVGMICFSIVKMKNTPEITAYFILALIVMPTLDLFLIRTDIIFMFSIFLGLLARVQRAYTTVTCAVN